MNLSRGLKHLCTGNLALRRAFDEHTLQLIAETVSACERRHAGEIRVALEAGLSPGALWRGQTPRERAVEVFSELRVWDTEHNNGVLIYVLFADRDVEIVADRGVGQPQVTAEEWERCCRIMETQFRAGHFREGIVAGIEAVAAVLAAHPPASDRRNELPDGPVVL